MSPRVAVGYVGRIAYRTAYMSADDSRTARCCTGRDNGPAPLHTTEEAAATCAARTLRRILEDGQRLHRPVLSLVFTIEHEARTW